MHNAESEVLTEYQDRFSCYLGNNFEYRFLLVMDDVFFVENCYLKILNREYDIQGRDYFSRLMNSKGKMAVISEMFFSEERISKMGDVEYSLSLDFFRIIFNLEKLIGKIGLKFDLATKAFGKLLERNSNLFRYFNEQNRVLAKVIDKRFLENEEKIDSFNIVLSSVQEKTNLHTTGLAELANFQQRYLLSNAKNEQSSVIKNEVTSASSSIDELDAYYKAFEDAYRGSNAEIRAKQSYYIPFIEDLKKRVDGRVAVDIGCGRGEWLKLLEEQNLSAIGVDMNTEMVKFCQSQSLVAVEADALSYLEIQRDNSVALISGFHIVEHIPFDIFFGIVKQIARVLEDGGIAIFETPNPENILVGSHYFYHDFSHKNPVTPLSLSFLFKYHGFSEVRIERVNPFPDAEKLDDESEVARRWNNHFYGAQDYAIVAIK